MVIRDSEPQDPGVRAYPRATYRAVSGLGFGLARGIPRPVSDRAPIPEMTSARRVHDAECCADLQPARAGRHWKARGWQHGIIVVGAGGRVS